MNETRLMETLLRIGNIGKDPEGGISRVFGSDSMAACQKELLKYFEECHMNCFVDGAGNVHGVYEAANPDADEIIMASHYDTVKQGGIYDGLLGIVAGAEAVRDAAESGYAVKKRLHVIATNGEEGNELGGTFGSRAYAGLLPISDPSFLEKAAEYGYTQEGLQAAKCNSENKKSYIELHIEQGPSLENHGTQIGVVTGIVGLRRYKVTVHGTSNHAGTTMMEDRDDALVKASRLIVWGDELARTLGHHMVTTVANVQVSPGALAVIPNQAQFILEIRNEENALMDHFIEEYRKQCELLGSIEVEDFVSKDPVKCDPSLVQELKSCVEATGLSYEMLPSGATHDGNAMAKLAPICMIFVPSHGGISHSPLEYTDDASVAAGAMVLSKFVKQLIEEK